MKPQRTTPGLQLNSVSRREFLRRGTLALAASWTGLLIAAPRRLSPNERLNVAVLGTANRAWANIQGVAQENIVALCDTDELLLRAAQAKFPGAKTYTDFRKLLEQRDIDAVVVSTADQTHAVATAAALRLGKHVYCEKPLTHTVHEARVVRKLAAANQRLATQMGTQIHAGENYRRVVELVQTGAIGPVTECHVWCEKSLPGGERPAETPAVPSSLHWDLWLGPAPGRPYHPDYLPKTWRRWWDFGEGILGDMACHYMDLPFWALQLGTPLSIEAQGPPVHPETVPAWMVVRYEFAPRKNLPALTLTWYDGGKRPECMQEGNIPGWRNGVLFVGSKGMLLADYGRRMLLPEEQFKGFQAPQPFIPKSLGHHNEWLHACKTGAPTTCNFAYAALLTETVLAGIVAYRSGRKLNWQPASFSFAKGTAAANYLQAEYRKGWTL